MHQGLSTMGVLRVFLAFSVMGWHLRPAGYARFVIMDGGTAVISFFIISGFYMSMVMTEKYSKIESGRTRFFINRFLRIFPLYFVVMVLQQITFSIDGVKTVFTSSLGMSALAHFSLVAMNLMKFGQDYWQTFVEVFQTNTALGKTDALQELCFKIFGASAFNYHPGSLLVSQGWSLASELTYYIMAPFVALSAWYWASVIGIGSLAIRMAFLFGLSGAYMGSWRTKFFPSILVFFILGHFAYRLYLKVKDWKHLNIVSNCVTLIWIALLVYGITSRGLMVGVRYDSILAWAFYSWITLSIPFLFAKTKNMKWDDFVGEFSYPIYLVHPILLQVELGHIHASRSGHYINLAVGTIFVCLALIFWVERPVNRLRKKITTGVQLKVWPKI